jgi:hypothetical protein
LCPRAAAFVNAQAGAASFARRKLQSNFGMQFKVLEMIIDLLKR